MTITEWRHRRYHAMQMILRRKIAPEAALEVLEEIWPFDADIVCDCGRRPPAFNRDRNGRRRVCKTPPLNWFNFHGMQCRAVGNIPTGSAERRAAR